MEQLLQYLLESSVHQNEVTQDLAKRLQVTNKELLDMKKVLTEEKSTTSTRELLHALNYGNNGGQPLANIPLPA